MTCEKIDEELMRRVAVRAGYEVHERSSHGPGRAWDWGPKSPMLARHFNSEEAAWTDLCHVLSGRLSAGSRLQKAYDEVVGQSAKSGERTGNVSLELLLLGDRDLQMRAGGATHQHYKGGLYRLLGLANDADTGLVMMHRSGCDQLVVYEHLWPHDRQIWLRTYDEFEGPVECPDWHPSWRAGLMIKRFRPLGSGWEVE